MGVGSHALARYPWRRLLAWVIDAFIVSFIVVLAFGELALAGDIATSLAVAGSSALLGAIYFFAFSGLRATPGLAIMRGSISTPVPGRFACAALFGAMLLPLGFVLLIVEPAGDVFGAFGAEVVV